ncbi:DUF1573 domain-containing protein [Frigoriglobus tundricola]|uniref:DUF1573 domain-containing protein n=1 Tax=Frigoriglobus tundricola TaxID=2774151 RepID=A0A6M5YY45_9BACT|nr:DUF1573 domain-containing protein [Frigoriglobus tundricola]QJW99037.1 hypothetical protein FTUN_6634 [Frigoriglobus tundricola]
MRQVSRFLAIGAVGLTLTVGAVAQPPAAQPAPAPPTKAAPWANKFFLPDIATNREQPAPAVITHNFGDVPHGTLCVHKFAITNIYDTPMQITDVSKTCTCLDNVPMTRVLQPNETAELTVTMNAAKFVGQNAQTFYVTFSSAAPVGPRFLSVAVLKVSANSRTDVSVNPGAVTFGSVPQGTRLNQAVQVKYSGRGRDWKITEVVPGTYPFEVKLSEVGRGGPIRGGAEYQIDVTLSANAPPGPITEQITLKTNDSTNPLIHIGVTGTVIAPLELSPNKLRLEAKVGEPVTQRVLVRAAKPFKVVGVDGTDGAITAELPAVPAALQVQFITIKFDPKQPGSVAKQLRIRTDLEGNVSALLAVEAEGTK